MSEKYPLILAPGLLCDEALWAAQAEGLSDIAEITVTRETWRQESIPAMAEAILAAAPPRFALAGLSMGGYVAFEIMRQQGARVSRLALLDTSARADSPSRAARRRGHIELVGRGRFKGISETIAKSFIHPDRHGDATLLDAVCAMGDAVGQEGFLRQQAAMLERVDSRPDLPRIACPTLVLCGRHDDVTPVELSREIADGIPGAVLEIIDFCGHLTTMERPAETNAALRRWLEG